MKVIAGIGIVLAFGAFCILLSQLPALQQSIQTLPAPIGNIGGLLTGTATILFFVFAGGTAVAALIFAIKQGR